MTEFKVVVIIHIVLNNDLENSNIWLSNNVYKWLFSKRVSMEMDIEKYINRWIDVCVHM